MKKFYKWIMNHWSKNIWESRIIKLKRFRFHPRAMGQFEEEDHVQIFMPVT